MVNAMRKRAQRKRKPEYVMPKHIEQKKSELIEEKPKIKMTKNAWIAISLIGIFLLVLFFNSFFNITSDVAVNEENKGFEKYYLSGPDPYYNLRLVKQTYETGEYPFYSEKDPLLNYPVGRTGGGRAPLFVMSSFGFSRFLAPFMDEVDAIGRSMQFVPALFGALLVFPVYFIGKTLFNKKAGLIAAFILAIIPIHIGSGHGSAYSLFDHDSFNLLMFFLTFLFLILSIKEKDSKKSILYALIGGVPLAGLTMVWVEAQFLYVIIAVYAIVQMIFDIFLGKIDARVFRSTSLILLTGYIVSMPVIGSLKGPIPIDITFFLAVGITAFGVLYYIFGAKKIPWTISLPAIFSMAAAALVGLYLIYSGIIKIPFLVSLSKLGEILFGSGIYGSKVALTIAEANTYQISNTVMSFGPSIYWVGWAGLLMLFYFYYKDKMRRDYLFMIVLFMINLWLTSTAGRFINDMVPLIAILSGGVLWFVIKKLDYRQMLRNIQSAGGGFSGLKKGIKLLQLVAIVFIAFVVILPNVFLVMDAAVPYKPYEKDDGNWTNLKWEVFGDTHSSAYGLSVGKEYYWIEAFNWLAEQDADIELARDRPAFISWWDYGFYEVAVGKHPTVADNFQDGIPPAGNFHTSTSENEAVAVWVTRLLEANLIDNKQKLSDEVKDVLEKYLGEESKNDIASWCEAENFEGTPSFGSYINEEYNEYISDSVNPRFLTIGAQWDENAFYHDMVDLLVKNDTTALTDEEITMLYHEIQEATGYSIRYYGVEGYDKNIFNIFAFLSDKSLVLLGGPDDDFVKITYQGIHQINRTSYSGDYLDFLNLPDDVRKYVAITNTGQVYKDAYFDTMFYKTYFGPYKVNDQDEKEVWDSLQFPCLNMKHFYAEYISSFDDPMLRYPGTNNAAVVIAKYYEGATINGTVLFEGKPVEKNVVATIRKDLTYSSDLTVPIDHDKFQIVGTAADNTSDGSFSLIAGAGAKLAVLRNLELSNTEAGAFVVKEINFTGTGDEAPITDDDAMRVDGSNYLRNITINIDPAFCDGYVFHDLDDDGKYNSSVDEPIKDAQVEFIEINQFNEQFQPSDYSLDYTATTDESGYYNTTGLMPGWYIINFKDNDFIIFQNYTQLIAGNQSQNAHMPDKSSVEGQIYYDDNFNGVFEPNSDEIIDNADVKLYYNYFIGNQASQKLIGNLTTGLDGRYSFTDIIPGQANRYSIIANSDTYQTEKTITFNESEEKFFNVSMDLIPVEVSGTANYDNVGVGDVDVYFVIDGSVENNTASDNTVITSGDGSYKIDLQPGYYNITCSKVIDQEGEMYVYQSLNNTLYLEKGQDPVTDQDFILEKLTVSVEGTVKYDGVLQENISIKFEPTGDYIGFPSATVISDENGEYIAEILPGEYNITATGDNISSLDSIIVEKSDISAGYPKNIILARDEDN